MVHVARPAPSPPPPRSWKPAARVPSLRSAEQSAVLPVVVAPNSLKARGESPSPAKEAQAASQVTPAGAWWKSAPRRSAAEAVREGSASLFLKSFFEGWNCQWIFSHLFFRNQLARRRRAREIERASGEQEPKSEKRVQQLGRQEPKDDEF